MLRIPHCLDSRLVDGGNVVSLTHPPHFTPQKHYYFNVSGAHFCEWYAALPKVTWVAQWQDGCNPYYPVMLSKSCGLQESVFWTGRVASEVSSCQSATHSTYSSRSPTGQHYLTRLVHLHASARITSRRLLLNLGVYQERSEYKYPK
jgi:hypothetical protein